MDSISEENGNPSNNVDQTSTNLGGHNRSTSSQTAQTTHIAPSQATAVSTPPNNSNNIQHIVTLPPTHSQASSASVTAAMAAAVVTGSVMNTTTNIVQYLSANPHGLPVQSVIHAANPASVIQTATGTGTNSQTSMTLPKSGGVLFVNKPNTTVIHTTPGNVVQIKPEPNTPSLDTNSEDSYTDEDSPRVRRELTRRPSYNKIYSEISGPDITGGSNLQMHENVGYAVLAASGTTTTGTTGSPTTGTLIHLPPENNTKPFFLPNRISSYNTNNSAVSEDQSRKREIRLQKNREAARECRRKKKEYIECLEKRVGVLERQNKALIEELKSLKQLYCQTKND